MVIYLSASHVFPVWHGVTFFDTYNIYAYLGNLLPQLGNLLPHIKSHSLYTCIFYGKAVDLLAWMFSNAILLSLSESLQQ